MADDDPTLRSEPGGIVSASTGWVRANLTGIIAVGTLLVSLVTAIVSSATARLVDSSAHAQAVTSEVTQNIDKLTQSFTTHDRESEEAADVTLTALDDIAQTSDDQITIMTIAARMLNPTACRSNGEATARFLAPLVARLKSQDTAQAKAVLVFARSRAFLDLASSDITTVYYDDDPIQEVDACSDPSPAPAPSPVASSRATTASARATSSPVPTATPTLGPAQQAFLALLRLRKLRDTPANNDSRNHATYWGDQTIWNDAKTSLFRELRPDAYSGWIHVATWEVSDVCVDASGAPRTTPHLECGAPIAVDYTSIGSPRVVGDTSVTRKPFWLGRSRFLRDAAPRMYAHPSDRAMAVRGKLGHVIGVVEEGECVSADEVRYYAVSPIPDRSFEHVWVRVHAADDAACDRSTSASS